MARLNFTVITSLDGYVADADGTFDWSVPDEEVHTFVAGLERQVGVYLYGRRLYETMLAWEQLDLTGQPSFVRDYAQLWRAAEKVVYSTTLQEVSSARTRIERRFDVHAVRRMKLTEPRDISVGGPHLAAQAIRAGLVDEFRQFLCPMIVGGGTRALPDGIRQRLELQAERRFANGTVYLAYAVG